MDGYQLNEGHPSSILERVLAAIVRTGMDRYWGSFARLAARSRGGVFAGGDMA
jgi:hypothetical protein